MSRCAFFWTFFLAFLFFFVQKVVKLFQDKTLSSYLWIDLSEPTRSEKYSALHTEFRNSEKLAITGRAQSTVTSYYPTKYTVGRFNEDGTVNYTQSALSYFRFVTQKHC